MSIKYKYKNIVGELNNALLSTGLTDCNLTEIWEGDEIEITDIGFPFRGTVTWENGMFVVRQEGYINADSLWSWLKKYHCEIVRK